MCTSRPLFEIFTPYKRLESKILMYFTSAVYADNFY